jgi:hypothetical protein
VMNALRMIRCVANQDLLATRSLLSENLLCQFARTSRLTSRASRRMPHALKVIRCVRIRPATRSPLSEDLLCQLAPAWRLTAHAAPFFCCLSPNPFFFSFSLFASRVEHYPLRRCYRSVKMSGTALGRT